MVVMIYNFADCTFAPSNSAESDWLYDLIENYPQTTASTIVIKGYAQYGLCRGNKNSNKNFSSGLSTSETPNVPTETSELLVMDTSVMRSWMQPFAV